MTTSLHPTVLQAFLQTFLLQHSLTRLQATTILARLLAVDAPTNSTADDHEDEAAASLDTYLNACNAKLVDLDFELKSTRDQTTGDQVYTFVNLSASESVKGGTSLAAVEVQFVKNMVELIFGENAGTRGNNDDDEEDADDTGEGQGVRPYYITPKQATLEAYPKDSTGRVTLTRGQVLDKLNGLVDLGWFDRFDPSTSTILTSSDDSTASTSNTVRYALSNRALSELGPYISDTFPRAPRCAACRELFTRGRVCRGCRQGAGKVRVHEACLGPFVAMKGPRCEGCGQEWETAYRLPF